MEGNVVSAPNGEGWPNFYLDRNNHHISPNLNANWSMKVTTQAKASRTLSDTVNIQEDLLWNTMHVASNATSCLCLYLG